MKNTKADQIEKMVIHRIKMDREALKNDSVKPQMPLKLDTQLRTPEEFRQDHIYGEIVHEQVMEMETK